MKRNYASISRRALEGHFGETVRLEGFGDERVLWIEGTLYEKDGRFYIQGENVQILEPKSETFVREVTLGKPVHVLIESGCLLTIQDSKGRDRHYRAVL